MDLGDLLNALHQGLAGGIDLPQHGKGGQAEDADGACRWLRMAATFQLRDKSDKKPGEIDGKSMDNPLFLCRVPPHINPPDSSKSSHRADRAATSGSPWVMDRSRGASHASPQGFLWKMMEKTFKKTGKSPQIEMSQGVFVSGKKTCHAIITLFETPAKKRKVSMIHDSQPQNILTFFCSKILRRPPKSWSSQIEKSSGFFTSQQEKSAVAPRDTASAGSSPRDASDREI